MAEMIICGHCGTKTPEEYAVEQGGGKVCEDCAMSLMSPTKICDPWAVRMAASSMTTKGEAIAALRGLEKKIHDLVTNEGRVAFEKLPEIMGVTRQEIERAAATLRHMELIRGDRRPDGGADCVPFDSPDRLIP